MLGASIGFVTLLAVSFFDFNLHIPANAILTVTLLALVTAHLRFASDRYWISQRVAGRVLLTLVLGMGFLYLAVQGWGLAREQRWLARAANPVVGARGQLAAYQRAEAAEPKNAETAYAIGELIRLAYWGDEGAGLTQATNALAWFQRSAALNRYDPLPVLRLGMCEHWLHHLEPAGAWFDLALRLDPNSYYVLAHVGWHYLQLEDYEKARDCFLRSLKLKPTDNDTAATYLALIKEKIEPKQAPPK